MKNILVMIMLFSFSNYQKDNDLKVISYNIRYNNLNDGINKWDNRKETLFNFLEDEYPDFIGMQEVLENQLNELQINLKDYSFIGIGREDGQNKGEFSPLFYLKDSYNVIKTSTFWLSDTPDKVSVGWDAALERICTYGYFESKKMKKRFWVFNTHFDHMGGVARKKSIELIISKIDKLNTENDPVVLMGDFNLIPISDPIKVLSEKFIDSFSINSNNLIGTYNGFNELYDNSRRIDYIFSKGLILKSSENVAVKTPYGGWASDHHPVKVLFNF
ncbi:MAG: endonuclease/exonuclease/phosphatase family protein [Flavobacteriaceae bacterium]